MAAKRYHTKHPSRDELVLLKVLHALSDEVRLEIVLKLAEKGAASCNSFGFSMPKSTLSHHFKVLRESGILATRREGKEWVNTIRKEDIDARFPGVLAAVISSALSGKTHNDNL